MRFFLFIVITFLLIGCEENDYNMEGENLKLNLLNSSLEKAKDVNLEKKNRLEALQNAYAIVSTFPDDTSKVSNYHKVSVDYYLLGDYNKYKVLNEKAKNLALSINDSLGLAKSLNNIGIYFRENQLDSAYKNFYRADKIYRNLDNKSQTDNLSYAFEHGKTLIDLAKLSRKVRDYSESEDLTIRAIQKFELAKKNDYLPLSYHNLGTVAKYLGRYDDAVSYHLKSIDYAKGIGKEDIYAVSGYNNIGTVYKARGQYEKAKEYYNKGLSYEEYLSQNPVKKTRLLDNLAYVLFLENSNDSRLPKLFFNSLKIREDINDLSGISTNALHLAEYYKEKGKDSLAEVYALRAKNISEKFTNNEELLKSYELLTEVSNAENGLDYAKAYIKLSDSLYNEERSFRDKFARIRFEKDKIEEENLQISRENEFLVIAVLGLTALFLLVYIIFRQQQSNKELLFAQAQQESNEEIYRLLLNQQVKLEEGRQMEQHRMSEELHDGVLGRLFGVRLSLDGLNQRANDGFTEARNKYIDELKSIEKEIRLISHDLGTDTLTPDVAYIDVVESLISDLCDAHQMDFEFSNDENIDWEEIDDQKKVNLLRILQESLQNIFKHAKATKVKISFDYIDNNINLTVLDNGVGFKSNRVKRGIGLKNITNRVGQMSGVVDFISNQDRGTTVHVSVPV